MYTYRVDCVNMTRVNTLCDDPPMERSMGDRLKEARRNAGFSSARGAALHFRWSTSTYGAHENGQNQFDAEVAAKYAKAFRVSPGWLLTGESSKSSAQPDSVSVSVVGIAGAGPYGEIDFYSSQGDIGRAPAPIGWTIKTVALEIRGSSMRPMAYDGWYAYYEENRTEISSDMFGEPCVVCLTDGRVFIKIPFPGSAPNKFHLESVNPAIDTLRDAEVEWASLVTAFIPRRAAKKIAEPGDEALT